LKAGLSVTDFAAKKETAAGVTSPLSFIVHWKPINKKERGQPPAHKCGSRPTTVIALIAKNYIFCFSPLMRSLTAMLHITLFRIIGYQNQRR